MFYSLYLHIPFCRHRCAYCDFNTYAGLDALIPAYAHALEREVACFSGASLPVHTLYFGGGTPSLLPLEEYSRILRTLAEVFDLRAEAEISLEANPGTLSAGYLQGLRALGVNRLSLGMQSAHLNELRWLERQHDTADVIQAVKWARQAGFDSLNLDLIFGLPGQSAAGWGASLAQAVDLQPEHLSLYSLTVEERTPLFHWVERGLVSAPDPDLAADLYEQASTYLEAAGYFQYEISNWARHQGGGEPDDTVSPSFACRHNLQYWRNQPYLGLGAGAHGYAGGFRLANCLRPATYIQRLEGQAAAAPLPFPRTPAGDQVTPIDRAAEIGETMMMGLRLTREGVGRAAFRERFGEELEALFGRQIERLTGQGLLEWAADGEILRLTRRGRLLGNRVFVEFI